MGRTITQTIAAALALAVLAAALVVWLVRQESDRQARTASRVGHARETLAALDGLDAGLVEADACRCAYVAGAEPGRRPLFQAAADRARRQLGRLRDLAAEDDGQGALLAGAGALVEQKLALLEQSLRLRDRQRFHDRGQLALSRQVRELDEALRGRLDALRAGQDRTLEEQTRETLSAALRTETVAGAGNLVGLLVLGLSVFGLSRQLVVRDRAEDEARQEARQAQQRADEQTGRLSEVQAALQELGQLRARAEEQLRQAQRFASVGRVTSGVAHDFNNLLTLILGCSETSLRSLPADDPARPFISAVVQAGQRAAVLTRQLLAAGRGKDGAPDRVDLNAVVTDLAPLLERLLGRQVEVAVRPAPGLRPVWVDPGQLEQVLLNLAANARDAMPAGGKLTVETLPADGAEQAVLAVTDTGCGMDAQTKARLFEPFFTTKEEGKGTGLGMAIIQDVVRRHGGRLEVDSEPGRGTAVRVYLPLAASPSPEAPAPKAKV